MSKEKHIKKLEYLIERLKREPNGSMIGKVSKTIKIYNIMRKIKELKRSK